MGPQKQPNTWVFEKYLQCCAVWLPVYLRDASFVGGSTEFGVSAQPKRVFREFPGLPDMFVNKDRGKKHKFHLQKTGETERVRERNEPKRSVRCEGNHILELGMHIPRYIFKYSIYIYIFKWEATLEALPEAPWISWTERWD